MRRTILPMVLFSLFLLGAVGCTHEHTLVAFSPARAPLQRAGNKKVAIVLDERLVQTRYETSTDGHTFVLNGAPAMLAEGFSRALAGTVAALQTFPAPPPTGFDVRIIPQLTIEASGMLSHRCTARLAISVEDRAGRPVMRKEGAGEETFVPIANGTAACETAILAAFNNVAYQALSAIDAMP